MKYDIFPWAKQIMRCNGRAFGREIHYAIMALNSCTDLIAIIPDTAYPGVSLVPIEKNNLGDMLHAETR